MSESVKNQIAENMRFYASMRFKVLTLFLAGLTLVGAGIGQYGLDELVPGFLVQQALAIAGALLTAVMWVMEVHYTLYWVAQHNKWPEACPQYKNKKFRQLNATNSVLMMHLVTYSFFLWLGYKWDLSIYVLMVLGALGLLVLVSTIANYLKLWSYNVP